MSDMLDFIIRRTRAQASALEALKAQANGHNYTELTKSQRACLRVERVASMALEYPEAFRTAYQAGQPEKMRYTEGGPLGGIITDAVMESVTPTMPVTPEETATVTSPDKEIGSPTEAPTQEPTPTPTLTDIDTPTPSPTATPVPIDTPPAPTPTAAPEQDETSPPEGNPSEAKTPPGQDVRPDTPPGQEETPAQPPGQDNRPDNPPDKETPGKNK